MILPTGLNVASWRVIFPLDFRNTGRITPGSNPKQVAARNSQAPRGKAFTALARIFTQAVVSHLIASRRIGDCASQCGQQAADGQLYVRSVLPSLVFLIVVVARLIHSFMAIFSLVQRSWHLSAHWLSYDADVRSAATPGGHATAIHGAHRMAIWAI